MNILCSSCAATHASFSLRKGRLIVSLPRLLAVRVQRKTTHGHRNTGSVLHPSFRASSATGKWAVLLLQTPVSPPDSRSPILIAQMETHIKACTQLSSHRHSHFSASQAANDDWAVIKLQRKFPRRMGARDVLADIATAAQLSGLHAIMLIALAARHLRIPQCKRECAKLEECARRLHALLRWPATGQEMVMRHPAMAALAVAALVEAAGLVASYRRSTLWRRARTGRSTETRLRGMRRHINYLCALVLCVHANLLTQQPAAHRPSETSHPNHQVSDGAQTSATPDSQGGAESDQPGGVEAV